MPGIGVDGCCRGGVEVELADGPERVELADGPERVLAWVPGAHPGVVGATHYRADGRAARGEPPSLDLGPLRADRY